MPNIQFKATATLNNGAVNWKLCHQPPGSAENCGNAKSPFPNVVLGANKGTYTFKFTIDDQTGKGIKFASDPIWIQEGSQPTGPGVDPQIEGVDGKGGNGKILTFIDRNDKPNNADPDPVILKYQLNFVDQNNAPVTSLDPDITNGGTNTKSYADYFIPVAFALLAGVALTIIYRKFVLRRAW